MSTLDLFDDPSDPARGPRAYEAAFDAWLGAQRAAGQLRERSSEAVYASMWGALAAWCVAQGLGLDELSEAHFDAYLRSRGGHEELGERHAWRLLTLADAVLAHRARGQGLAHRGAAQALLMATPEWRYANAADKNPLPEHLDAQQARRLVAWLLAPSADAAADGSWQALRNRAAVALQLGAGLTPGDVRAALRDGVVSVGGKVAGLPWKLRLPAHGSIAEREAPIAPWCGRLLRSWLEVRASAAIAGPMLFPATRKGRPWGKVAQYGSAKAVLAAAGVPAEDGGSFKLRHTFALRQLRRGTPPEQVAQWMGLADAAALARYRRVLLAPPDVV